MWPLSFESPWPAVVILSLMAASGLLLLFQMSANPVALRRGRDRLVARVLELLLFRHDLGVSLSACGRIAIANLRYLSAFMIPMLVSLVPFWCLFSQMAAWFENRPLRRHEKVILEIELVPQYSVTKTPVVISTSSTLRLLNAGVRVPARNELCLALRAEQAGPGWVEIQIEHQETRCPILISDQLARVSTLAQPAGFWSEFFSPTETPLAPDSHLNRIQIRYPVRQILIGDLEVHWTMVVFVLIMGFSFGLSWWFGVRIS